MKSSLITLSLCLFVGACNDSKKENKASGEAPATANTGTGTGTQTDPNDGYFTGFDGVNDYSLLIPQFRTMTIADSSVAKIEQVKVKLSEATVTKLLEEEKAKNPQFDSARFKTMLEREITVNKITPLKAGRTVIKTSGGRCGKTGRDQRAWGKSKDIDLVITSFTQAEFEAGKKRYETDGGAGSLKACKSCHETGEQGAPPHELGKVNEFNDADALAWFKTGQVKAPSAKIEHKWGFSSDIEEKGIVAFMRTKQTNDVEGLTKLVFEDFIANGFPEGCAPPPP